MEPFPHSRGWMFWRSLQGLATAPIYTSISGPAGTSTPRGESLSLVKSCEISIFSWENQLF